MITQESTALDIEPFFSPRLKMKESAIAGYGVFATAQIEVGELLVRFGGRLLVSAHRYNDGVLRSTAISVGEGVILAEPVEGRKDLSDHLNHSCEPNAGLRDAVTLVAIKPIGEGQEITVDYAMWEGDENYVMKKRCNCGAAVCRGFIRGTDWQNPELQERYGRFFSPFLRRKMVRC